MLMVPDFSHMSFLLTLFKEEMRQLTFSSASSRVSGSQGRTQVIKPVGRMRGEDRKHCLGPILCLEGTF